MKAGTKEWIKYMEICYYICKYVVLLHRQERIYLHICWDIPCWSHHVASQRVTQLSWIKLAEKRHLIQLTWIKFLVHLGALLGPFWEDLGALLGSSCLILGRLGAILSHPGSFLGTHIVTSGPKNQVHKSLQIYAPLLGLCWSHHVALLGPF